MVVNGFARLGARRSTANVVLAAWRFPAALFGSYGRGDERFFTVLAAEIAKKISEFESKPSPSL